MVHRDKVVISRARRQMNTHVRERRMEHGLIITLYPSRRDESAFLVVPLEHKVR